MHPGSRVLPLWLRLIPGLTGVITHRMKEQDVLGLGVIGAGKRGKLGWAAHRPEEGVRLLAACDPRESALQVYKESIGPELFTTHAIHELLKRDEIQAVLVTSPDGLHEEHAVAALEAGKAVYLEKPMAITIAGCDRILEAARRSGSKLYLGHNMRFMGYIRKMKALIDAGAIGEVKAAWCRHFIAYGGDAYFKDWHAERKHATGLLLQKAAHDIDVLHWLCGGTTRRVNAMGALTLYDRVTDRHAPEAYGDARFDEKHWPPLSQKGLNPVIDVEDLEMMNMALDNGVLATYMQCQYAPDAWRNYTFIGSEGRIENFGTKPGACVVRLWNRRVDHYQPYGDEQFFVPAVQGGHGGADPSILDEFLAYVRWDKPVTTSPLAARNAVAAGCCATESLRSGGQPLDVPPVPADLAAAFTA